MTLLHSERNWKSLFLTYEIHTDKLRLQSLLIFYWFEIPYTDIKFVRVGKPLVFLDAIKNKDNVQILKNDLADLFEHLVVQKKTGIWKQIRFTPRNPKEFYLMFKTYLRI